MTSNITYSRKSEKGNIAPDTLWRPVSGHKINEHIKATFTDRLEQAQISGQ